MPCLRTSPQIGRPSHVLLVVPDKGIPLLRISKSALDRLRIRDQGISSVLKPSSDTNFTDVPFIKPNLIDLCHSPGLAGQDHERPSLSIHHDHPLSRCRARISRRAAAATFRLAACNRSLKGVPIALPRTYVRQYSPACA